MKKILYLIILIIPILLLTGCDSDTQEKSNKPVIKTIESNGEEIKTKNMTQMYCTREASATGIEVNIHYDIFYTDDKLNIVHSVEQVISPDPSKLDTYEKAYKGIHEHYIGLEYYDTKVERNDTSVTSDITINYDKIDIDKLISIEGVEDNVFENKVPKYSKWIALAKKFGVKCEEVTK